jgi:phage-related protein
LQFELHSYPGVWAQVQGGPAGLRGACAAMLDRLRLGAANIRVEKVRSSILELKVSWGRQEFRFLFFYAPGRKIYLVNFFQKKTRKTPPSEIDLAIVRMREIELGNATPASVALN